MGKVPLLTRSEEIALAEQMERGDQTVLAAVFHSRFAVAEIAKLAEKLRAGRIRARAVLRDLDGDWGTGLRGARAGRVSPPGGPC